ncbi:MRPL44 [Candida jiufengensis]|uniref:MRPL44 n=1 Tax=Candida jiufengensis TaxID=497108 RepID=UPI00222422BD|nr:MRPL44 [Candida jiufengensis]KAI5954552.1 MRPL44 [Candida jiufengensis]
MSMITKYFTNVSIKFNPFTPGAKSARIFLSRMPSTTKIDYKVLNGDSKDQQQEIKIVFKDKHVMKADPSEMNVADLTDYFNSHSRKLAIKDSIQE